VMLGAFTQNEVALILGQRTRGGTHPNLFKLQ
jgi:hypothetical protein